MLSLWPTHTHTARIVRADAGGEGGVIANSAVSLLQGLFPANSNYSTTLSNGTTIEGPLNGYQVRCIRQDWR